MPPPRDPAGVVTVRPAETRVRRKVAILVDPRFPGGTGARSRPKSPRWRRTWSSR